MAKVKRLLTEQEDKLLSELRNLQNGSITQEVVDAAVEAVKGQRGFDTALYNRGDLSIEAFMRENFGIVAEEHDDEPSQTYLIDFQ